MVMGEASFPARISEPAVSKNAAVDFLDEMIGAQEIGNAIESVVVEENRPQQRLLGLRIMGRRAIGRFGCIGDGHKPSRELFDGRHDSACCCLGYAERTRELNWKRHSYAGRQ